MKAKPYIDDESLVEFDGQGRALRPSTEYDAIGIAGEFLTVLDEDGMPALYPRLLFDVVDDSDTADWIWECDGNNLSFASPRELHSQGFYYADYYDGDPEAGRIFEEFRAKMGLRPRNHNAGLGESRERESTA